MPQKFSILVAAVLLLTPLSMERTRAAAPAAPVTVPALQPAAILQALKSFNTTGSVLMIAAHPDDENTQLITYLARGRGYRMAYLSLTRGDGGQNLLGPEFGEELGLIRTEELLAARRLDLGQQFFTRAMDFGFSKNPEETLKIWDRTQVLADTVRVIRQFRPDVVVLRFSPTGTNTHGHHTASGILGQEAFKLAGDANAYPEQLTGPKPLTTWQPKRVVLNAGQGGGARGGGGATVTIDAGGVDPVLNESFGDIAARSRAMHKSQGFGNIGARGGAGGASPQALQVLGGDAMTTDIMDGIDTTWKRIPIIGENIATLTADAVAKFDPANPAASVPALLAIKKAFLPYEIQKRTGELMYDRLVDEKQAQLDRILADCLGLEVSSLGPAEVVPGDDMHLIHAATIGSNIPVRWTALRYPSTGVELKEALDLRPGVAQTIASTQKLPAETPVSQPYWLREEPAAGIFKVADPSLIGRPENPPVFPVLYVFDVGGETLIIRDEPKMLSNGSSNSKVTATYPRRLEVIAPVSMAFPSEVRLFPGGAAKSVDVEITAHHANANGSLQLQVPAGWKISPENQPFQLAAPGARVQLSFTVTPPGSRAAAEILAVATVDGQTYSTGRKEIDYPHIPHLLLQPPAIIKAVSADVATRGKTVGYLPGAGDSVAECIAQMGYTVTPLKTADLTAEGLKRFDAVVIGVRAFNTRDDLAPNSPSLKAIFDYVLAGGTVIEQYNRPDGLRNTTLAPYNIHPSALRVTDENAAITFLAPDHPVLNTPNKITAADFANWVQERSIYLPDQWGAEFTPILGAADPGEKPPNSALLVAQSGKGYFVYTSLVFFRQLPAANPGAYRLFANMLSLGKP